MKINLTLRTKMRLKVGVFIVVLFGTVFGTLAILSEPSLAIEDSVTRKAILYGLSQCYKNGAITPSITGSSYDGTYTLMTYGGSNHVLPTGKYSLEYASCSELLNGKFDTDFSGAISMAGINAPENSADTSALSSFLTGLGYTETKGTSGRCASFTYKYESSDSTAVYKMCADTEKVDGKDIITGDIMEVSGDTTAMSMKVKSGVVELYCNQLGRGGCSDHSFTKGSTNFDEFAGEILADLKEHNSSAVCFLWWCPWKLVESVGLENKSDVTATYEISNTTSAINKMIKYLSNGSYSSISNLSLSNNERINLLQDYLLNYYKVKIYGDRCGIDESQQAIARSAGYDEITTTMFGGGLQTCWITPTEHKSDSVVAYSRGGYVDGTMMSYSDIITALGGTVNTILDSDKARCNSAATTQYNEAQAILSHSTDETEIQRANATINELATIKSDHGEYWYTNADGAIVCYPFTGITGSTVDTTTTSPSIPSSTPVSDDTDSKPNCFTDGSSLGWILCSTLEVLGNAVNGMYDNIEGEWLEIKSGEMAVGGGVYNGWSTFRDYANIIFVIMLVVVIFSQVTGLGLTNYGIKKTLPTLIMVAVLVNLSFILCQLAVDVTNILGEGLRDLFEGIRITGTGYSIRDFVQGFGSTLLQLAVVTGGSVAVIHFAGVNLGMLLVPILLAFIAALVGVLIFFLSLAIRKAGIFAMIVLCPVAIICYALPNTKKFFDKWLRLFTGLLMIFPICGILMGGGQFFSSILLTTDDRNVGFFMALTAMLIEVVPFFFIPTLVSRSLNMMGGIGAKLAGLQARFSRGAQGALSHSHWAQERQQRLMRDASIKRDSRLASKWQKSLQNLDTKRNADGELSRKNQKRYRRAEYELGRARSRSDRAMIEDMQNSVMAGREALAPGTMRYENVMDKLRNATNDEEVEEWRNSLLNKHMTYSDGSDEISVDANTIGKVNADGTLDTSEAGARNSMSAALLHSMRQYDANPSDKSALARIRALTKQMLDAGGDAGQTAVANTLRGYTSAAGGNSTRTQAFNSLTDYISRNGKWMAQLKPTDRGAFNLVSAGASSTAVLKPSSDYNIAGGYASDMVPGLSDGAFDALDLEIANAHQSRSMSDNVKNSILQLNSTLETAYNDPRISGRIKPNVTERANRIHEEAYKIERDSWLKSNDNVRQLQGIDASTGQTVNAVGTQVVNGQKCLVGANNQVLRSLYGTGNAGATEAYRRQIKDYQPLRADKAPADMNVPH